tara:strand:+ start:382 stop:900 length:519 start_codon:yes stop_codon:yes gene_type:complete
MKNKILAYSLIILFIFIFIVLYKGLNNSNIYTPRSDGEKDIPIFIAKKFDSDLKVSSEEIFVNEKFYLVNIWASWCIPCRDEHSYLMKIKKDTDIEIIGLNYKDEITNAKKFLKELKNPYQMIFSDRNGTLAIEWGAYGVPESFLVNNGKIIKKFIGPINKDSLLVIKNILK